MVTSQFNFLPREIDADSLQSPALLQLQQSSEPNQANVALSGESRQEESQIKNSK